MTNMPKYLQNSRAIERRYYDFHKMCFTNCTHEAIASQEKFLNTKSEIEKHILSNVTTALVILEKQSKHSLAILIQLM